MNKLLMILALFGLIGLGSAISIGVVQDYLPDGAVLIHEGASVPICYGMRIISNVSLNLDTQGPNFVDVAHNGSEVIFRITPPASWKVGDEYHVMLRVLGDKEQGVNQQAAVIATFAIRVVNDSLSIPPYRECPKDNDSINAANAKAAIEEAKQKEAARIDYEAYMAQQKAQKEKDNFNIETEFDSFAKTLGLPTWVLYGLIFVIAIYFLAKVSIGPKKIEGGVYSDFKDDSDVDSSDITAKGDYADPTVTHTAKKSSNWRDIHKWELIIVFLIFVACVIALSLS